jgi:hypothetical protein
MAIGVSEAIDFDPNIASISMTPSREWLALTSVFSKIFIFEILI